jgi:hypothetical protein
MRSYIGHVKDNFALIDMPRVAAGLGQKFKQVSARADLSAEVLKAVLVNQRFLMFTIKSNDESDQFKMLQLVQRASNNYMTGIAELAESPFLSKGEIQNFRTDKKIVPSDLAEQIRMASLYVYPGIRSAAQQRAESLAPTAER